MRKRLMVAMMVALSLPAIGTASAAGHGEGCDYNGDGYADLYVGAPGEDRNGVADTGTSHVLYGTAAGLAATGTKQFHQGMTTMQGNKGPLDTFGQAVDCGDFNGDGYDDVAVGVPGDLVNGKAGAGAVNVMYGSAAGLTTDGDQRLHQDIGSIEETAETLDLFGASVAVGDFNGDGWDDLAIGVPGEDFDEDIFDAGLVHILKGGPTGLKGQFSQVWHQNTPNVKEYSEPGDAFGHNMVAGDFDGDGRDDLAIAAAFEDLGQLENGGIVHILYGFGGGLTGFGDQTWHQNRPGLLGANGTGDLFGDGLASGDFNGDGYTDLAIGVPGDEVAGRTDAGAVNVLFGTAAGLDGAGSTYWHLGRNIPGRPGNNTHFGFAVAAGDINGDTFADLVVGVPGENVDAGTARLILGSADGLVEAGAQKIAQGLGGYPETSEAGDRFSGQIVVGDFNGDGKGDTAFGALGEDSGAGNVTVMPGSASGITWTGASSWTQDTPGVPEIAEGGDSFGVLGNPSYFEGL